MGGFLEEEVPFPIGVSLSTSVCSVMFIPAFVELLVLLRVFAILFARLLRWGGRVGAPGAYNPEGSSTSIIGLYVPTAKLRMVLITH